MAANAGEKAQRTGDFKCGKCGNRVHVIKGKAIPKCPECGNDTFVERENEPGNRSTR